MINDETMTRKFEKHDSRKIFVKVKSVEQSAEISNREDVKNLDT